MSLQDFALLAGGSFFLWKLCTGWLYPNMGLCIRTKRHRRADGKDGLAVTVMFDKGSVDSVWLRDVEVRLTAFEGEELSDKSVQYVRIRGFQPVPESSTQTVDWGGVLKRDEIAVSPGEKLEYAGYAVIDADRPYLVEVAVLADRTFFRLIMDRCIQWRASAVSLPDDDGE
jgi:hypothetical protein